MVNHDFSHDKSVRRISCIKNGDFSGAYGLHGNIDFSSFERTIFNITVEFNKQFDGVNVKSIEENYDKLKKKVLSLGKEGEILDLAVENSIVNKSGAWYAYQGSKIGQGKENAKLFLINNPDIQRFPELCL